MKNYKELKIWKKGIDIVLKTYDLTKKFPSDERFGLVSQLNRAVVSIPANIAEGSSRDSEKDNTRFLQIALGSAFEAQTYFVLAKELRFIETAESMELEAMLEEEIKMIHGFIRTLKN